MKKIYISADIEGITGVTSWNETEIGNFEYPKAASQMTKEVAAACRGAFKGGADEVWVRDAHDSARNIDISELPRGVKIIRGWGNTPDGMMEEIDKGFDGAICIGYHSEAGTDFNPLSHTITNKKISEIKLNDRLMSELEFNSLIASQYNVPIIFISGDEGICNKAKKLFSNIVTVPVKRGSGDSTINLHPLDACEKIEEGVEKSVLEMNTSFLKVEDSYDLVIRYNNHKDAKKSSIYPGARKIDACTVGFSSNNLKEILVAKIFMI